MPAPDGCPRPRRPYHVLLTAASGIYQEWQTRIAYYHYKKLKAQNPCSDIGGFTRLLNTHGARPDALVGEIPTVAVRQLSGGRCDECDHGFIVMNRPFGIRQFVSHRGLPATSPRTTCSSWRPTICCSNRCPTARARPGPSGFGFYYMTYRYDPPKLRPVVAKYHDPDAVDPVGPSPVVISKRMLQRVDRAVVAALPDTQARPSGRPRLWLGVGDVGVGPCDSTPRDSPRGQHSSSRRSRAAWASPTSTITSSTTTRSTLTCRPAGPAGGSATFGPSGASWAPIQGRCPPRRVLRNRSTHTFVKIMNEAMLSFGAAWAPPRRRP